MHILRKLTETIQNMISPPLADVFQAETGMFASRDLTLKEQSTVRFYMKQQGFKSSKKVVVCRQSGLHGESANHDFYLDLKENVVGQCYDTVKANPAYIP